MGNKFYKLVDGILWADWTKPICILGIYPCTVSGNKKCECQEYNSRPHYPLSGTLEGKERYEKDVDFKIVYGNVYTEIGKFAGASEVAIPIAQPVEGEKEDLLPCPFCGGKAEILEIGNNFTKKRRAEIKCTECHIYMLVGAIHNSMEWCVEKVSEKWNKRIKPNSDTDDERSVATIDQSGNESPLPNEELYRWVKASERLPGKDVSVIGKTIEGSVCWVTNMGHDSLLMTNTGWTAFNRIEWLEKITPDQKINTK